MLGAVGAWLTRDLWGPAPEGAAEHPVLGMPEGPTIAVLPFANLSDDAKQEYFSDGLTEDLMTDCRGRRATFACSRATPLFNTRARP